MSLKADYKDDIFTGNRKYTIIDNGDGTKSLVDATTYEQVGDTFGASDMNTTNTQVNANDAAITKMNHTNTITLGTSWTAGSSGKPYYQDVNITGMTATDIVRVIPVYTNKTIEQIEAIDEEIYKIKYFDTMAGKLRFYASEQTTASLSLIVVGV